MSKLGALQGSLGLLRKQPANSGIELRPLVSDSRRLHADLQGLAYPSGSDSSQQESHRELSLEALRPREPAGSRTNRP